MEGSTHMVRCGAVVVVKKLSRHTGNEVEMWVSAWSECWSCCGCHGLANWECGCITEGVRTLPTSSPLVLIEYQIAFIAILIYMFWGRVGNVVKVLANS